MSIGKIKDFDVKNGTWSAYVERLEMYFKVNNVKEDLRLPTLIAGVGDEAYELMTNLASPKKPSELTYVEVVSLMKEHLQPAPSVLAERYRFRQKKQGDECISDYVAELKKAARFCKFEENLSINLRDQFVCGLKTDLIRQRLFAEDDNLSFSEAVKKATGLEAAIRESAAVDVSAGVANIGATAAGHEPVHSIKAGHGFHAKATGFGGSGKARGARGGWNRELTGPPRQNLSGGGTQHCSGCGANNHGYNSCKFRHYECSRCRRVGHLRRVCPEQKEFVSRRGRANLHAVCGETEDFQPCAVEREQEFHHLCLKDYPPVIIPITVNTFILSMEIDTGSPVSCISSDTYKAYFKDVVMHPPDLNLTFYDGRPLMPVGVLKPKVRYGDIEKVLDLFVIKNGTTPLLGRQWLKELKIGIPDFADCHNISSNDNLQLNDNIKILCDRYKELFQGGLGRYTGGKATLRLRPGAIPVFHRARPLPYALRARGDAELDAMLRDGIIEPVDCSDWASPLVPVNKPDGSLRICADYKATVNPALLVDRYPLPKIDDLIVRLGESQFFSKIDLSQAYNQIVLDESNNCTVINTHRGLFRYNRLVFGLASSPGIFQRFMCTVLGGIPNVEVFLDDVVIGGKNVSEHLQALEAVFSRLRQNGLRLKSTKCVFLVNEIKYLGFVLSKEGVKTDPDKVEAITKIPRPTNVTELRSFLGLINFYGKFVRHLSGRLVPLYDLLKKKVEWFWSQECEEAFKEIKNVLSTAPVLAFYDPDRPLILTCDASARGIGGVLSLSDRSGGGERPIAYVSRTLTDAEKNYSQIHREALAIIFCVNKFHQYLYGRHFTLRTDHKPLVSIFGPHTGVPAMAASRMERWALILAAYTFTIEYVRTSENGADGLSRLPVARSVDTTTAPEQTYLHFIQEALLLNYNEVRSQTGRDPIMSRVLRFIREGWPTECDITGLQPFYNRKDELYEELGCIMWGHRLVIPESCKERVLRMPHEPHMGIVKSKALARSYVWWPGIDEAVERLCRECNACAAQADFPPRQAPSMWPWPNRQWTRIHLDFMGPIVGKTYLVVIDAMSKWVEIFQMFSTTASAVIATLCELFGRWGLPKQIVSDNGPPFSSVEMHSYCQGLGIEHIFSAPYHPASNGLAEVTVKSLKRVIKKAMYEKQDVNRALWTYLLYYRNTDHPTTGQSPAMLLQGRRLRTKLDILKPDTEINVHKAQQRQKLAAGGGHRDIGLQEEVWFRQYLKGEKWVPGQVVDRTGSNDYKIKGSDGSVVHRHVDQLRRRSGRQSLVYPVSENIEPSVRTNSSHKPNTANEQSLEDSAEQSAESEANAVAIREPEPGQSVTPSSSTPGSPVFQDALPNPPSPPQPRPLRQCRLKEIDRLNL